MLIVMLIGLIVSKQRKIMIFKESCFQQAKQARRPNKIYFYFKTDGTFISLKQWLQTAFT